MSVIPEGEWIGWAQINDSKKWHHIIQDSLRPERWRIACRRRSFSYRLNEVKAFRKESPSEGLCAHLSCLHWKKH